MITPVETLSAMLLKATLHEVPIPTSEGMQAGRPVGYITVGKNMTIKAIQLQSHLEIEATPGRIPEGGKGDWLCYNETGQFYFIMPGGNYEKHLKPYRVKGGLIKLFSRKS